MKNKLNQSFFEKSIKNLIQKQINETINGKCVFFCYQPQIPTTLQKKISTSKKG